MGNTVSGSKDRHIDETVDFGYLSPQGVYTGPQDWNQQIVGHLIVDRKLAPFYRPLEDYDESWDDERILAARKDSPNSTTNSAPPPTPEATSSKFHHNKHTNKTTGKEAFRPSEASVYKGAVECPICFLFYPPNINRSRCCDQAICTECFVQIKRAEPTTTHLVSEPASCPYCVQDNFGVIYEAPPWRAGLVREGISPGTPTRPDMQKNSSASSADSEGTRRRKSFSADSPEVVTIDQIRPDWEAKLAAVRAAVTRRANRRIIMRQVGDRLIPIGITSGRLPVSGTDTPGSNGAEGTGVEGNGQGTEGRRRRRIHNTNGQELNQLLGSVGIGGMGIAGQDLEELMVMEAMRLSLLEHQEQQRRQNQNESSNASQTNNNNSTPPVPDANRGHTFNILPLSSNSTAPSPTPSPRNSTEQHTSSSPPPDQSISSRSRFLDAQQHRRRGSSPIAAALGGAARTASAFVAPRDRAEERNEVSLTSGELLMLSEPSAISPSERPTEASTTTLTEEVSPDPVHEADSSQKSYCDPQLPGVCSIPSPLAQVDSSEPVAVPPSVQGVDSTMKPSQERDLHPTTSSPPTLKPVESIPAAPNLTITTPADEGPRDYQPLASSTESSDPLLGWNT